MEERVVDYPGNAQRLEYAFSWSVIAVLIARLKQLGKQSAGIIICSSCFCLVFGGFGS